MSGKIISDHSKYSRRNLGEALHNESYERQCDMVRTGSDSLLRALWRSHPNILTVAEQSGRLVVRL